MDVKKLIVIVGPTASGKSELAVKLAKLINGEIISADSRQIYRGLDIGTGKVPGQWRNGIYYYKDVPHHAIDCIDPKKTVSAAQFQKMAQKSIRDIHKRARVPIICGGTAQWINSVVYNQKFPEVKPNMNLRTELETKTTDQLFSQLQKLDPERATTIDSKNPRRLIRALEIVISTGGAVLPLEQKSKYDALWLGIKVDRETLAKKIDTRLQQWLKNGMIKEIENLHNQGLPWERFNEFGLEYKFGALYLQNKITYEEMINLSSISIKQYSKRQMTWWKKNRDIQWVISWIEAKKITNQFKKNKRST